MRWPGFFVALVVVGCVVGAGLAIGQGARTLKIIVPYPPGGSADIQARLLAQEITRSSGQPSLVENRPGAGTILATEAVARAAPDGTTVLQIANAFVINPHLRKLPYEPLTAFEPICQLVNSPQLIVVNRASHYQTLQDLIDDARAHPGEIALGSSGPATGQHVAVEMFRRAAKVDLIYVPYPGGIPSVNAVLGGHVPAVMANLIEVAEHLASGQLRALATTARERIDTLPDVRTVAEYGYPDYAINGWVGIVAPARTPPDITAHLIGLFSAALRAPDVTDKLRLQGLYPVDSCGAAFGRFLREEYDKYGRAIRDGNIRAE